MPSLAFATAAAHTHEYAHEDAKDGTISYANFATAISGANSKYVKVTKDPTCTKDGEAVFTCVKEDCDPDYIDNSITVKITHAHKKVVTNKEYSAEALAKQLVAQYDEDATTPANTGWTQADADAFLKAAPTANNNEAYCYYKADEFCAECGKILGNIPARNSITKTSPVVAAVDHERATTSSTGCSAKEPCAKCGESVAINGTSGDPAKHVDSGKYVQVSPATCTAPAQQKKVCANCGEPYGAAQNVPGSTKLGHDISSAKVSKEEATTDAGIKNGYFAVMGEDSFGNAVVDAYYKVNSVIATEKNSTANLCHTDTMGLKCANCDLYVDCTSGEKKINTLTFVASTELHDAAKATMKYTSHNFKTKEVAADCTHNAKTVKTCTDCNLTPVEDPKPNTALGHNYSMEVVEADCTHNADFKITCSNKDCNVSITKADFTTHPAYFTTTGNQKYFVGVNNDLTADKYIKIPDTTAVGTHKFGAKELYKAADCDNAEVWVRKCKTCGKINPGSIEKVGNALGHKLEKVNVPATCGEYGYTVEKCSNCSQYVAALGGFTDDIRKAAQTEDKNAKPLVSLGSKHTYNWVVTTPSNVFEEGVKELQCSVCGVADGSKAPIAKTKYAAPAVKAGKKSATVTVKATAGAVSYKISYKKAGGSYKTIAARAGKKTIKKLAKGKKYTFKAIAVNAEGVEVASATKTVKVK